jgi:hypothetical protein
LEAERSHTLEDQLGRSLLDSAIEITEK